MKAILALGLVVGCDVGSVLPNGADGGNRADGSTGCANLVSPAPAGHVHLADGLSRAGLNCVAAGCHLPGNLGAGANPYTFAGTVLKTLGGTAAPGTTVRITGGLTATTDADGNFFGSAPVNFPANTNVTTCPTVRSMIGMLTLGGGSCNNCHTANAGVAPPIYLQ